MLKSGLLSLIWLLKLITLSGFSQQFITVKGKISNGETGEPIEGANIVVNETKQGTSAGKDGFFEIRLKAGQYHLTISALSFADKEMYLSISSRDIDLFDVKMEPESLKMDEIYVVGEIFSSKHGNYVSREQTSIIPAISSVSSVDIEKQGSTTLVDALKYTPGGWIETRGRKTKQFFSVRGQKYPYPDYSINGIWQKEFEETSYLLSTLDIESVEVVRSGNAIVKGLSGLTGVVDVKTKKAVKENLSVSAKYGTLNNYMSNLTYGNKFKNVAFNTSASLFGTDGPPDRHGKERITNLSGSLDWQVHKRVLLDIGATYIGGLRELMAIEEPGVTSIANSIEKFEPVRTILSYMKVYYKGNDGSKTELQTNLSHRNNIYTNYNIPNQTSNDFRELDYEYGMNVLHSRSLTSTNTLRAGLLYNHWVAPNGKRFYTGRPGNIHTWSGVVASEQKAGKFIFDGAVRLISGYIVEWGGFNIEGTGTPFQNVMPIQNEMAPFEWQTALGGTYVISGTSSLHYNFSGGTIAPRNGSLNDLGQKPETETRLQHDLGFRYKSDKKNELMLSAFYNDRLDAIELSGDIITDDDGLVMELYENTDKRNYGLELSAKINLPIIRSFLFANATIMNQENKIEGRYEEDKETPKIIYNLGLQFDYYGFDASLYVNYTGPYANNRFVKTSWVNENGDFPLGDFFALDMTAGYTLSRKIVTRFFLEGKNLLDEKYMTVAGYPDPGRLVLLGIKVNFL